MRANIKPIVIAKTCNCHLCSHLISQCPIQLGIVDVPFVDI